MVARLGPHVLATDAVVGSRLVADPRRSVATIGDSFGESRVVTVRAVVDRRLQRPVADVGLEYREFKSFERPISTDGQNRQREHTAIRAGFHAVTSGNPLCEAGCHRIAGSLSAAEIIERPISGLAFCSSSRIVGRIEVAHQTHRAMPQRCLRPCDGDHG